MGDIFTVTYQLEDVDFTIVNRTVDVEAKDLCDAVKKAQKQLGNHNTVIGVMKSE